ncbi:MAG: hypothetical protein HY908_10870 [Myxococcales bacterium]|nr:hypothetical protein [Myxococcales bacterium]
MGDYSKQADKYALLLVPDYDSQKAGSQRSYSSLGATPASASAGGTTWAAFEGLTKGARDHTDGDRVDTTQGRDLEVIGGNYELHVRGTNAPTAYGASSATAEKTTFRDDDEAFVRLGAQADPRFPASGTGTVTLPAGEASWPSPHLPAYLGLADDAQKKTEIEAAIKQMKERSPRMPFTWEDHASGHRISTTGGDKIEIIKGKNFTHVLGADDFDVSEGELQIGRTGPNPKAYTGQTVPAAERGTKKPYVVERSWAKRSFSESWFGEARETPPSKLGLDAEVTKPVDDAVCGDGESVEYVYATKLKSYSGASAARIGQIYEETWADNTTSVSDVTSVNETSTIKDSISTTTINGFAGSTTTLNGTQNDNTHGPGNLVETTAVGTHTETEATGVHTEWHFGAIHGEFEVGLLHLAFEASAASVELTLAGIHFELELSEHWELDIGEKWEIKGACHSVEAFKDLYFAKKAEAGLTSSKTWLSAQWTALKTKLGV